jgi:hypothetical protein
MLAELCLVLLLQLVAYALVAVEVLEVRLLSQLPEDLAWWVVEVPWASICVKSIALVAWLALAGAAVSG